jgi:hypothetical protein
MEAEEDVEDGVFYVNALIGGGGQEEDEDGIYYVDISPKRGSKQEEKEGGSWWTPDQSWLEAAEEDEEEVLYLKNVLSREYSVSKDHESSVRLSLSPLEEGKEGEGSDKDEDKVDVPLGIVSKEEEGDKEVSKW